MLVPGGGVEPPRAEARRILSPLHLPVPPSRLYLQVLILRPVYGSVPFSSKMTNVQLYKKVCQFPQTSTVHCHFSNEALAADSLPKSPLPSHKKAPAGNSTTFMTTSRSRERHQFEPTTQAVRTLQVADIFACTIEACRDPVCGGQTRR